MAARGSGGAWAGMLAAASVGLLSAPAAAQPPVYAPAPHSAPQAAAPTAGYPSPEGHPPESPRRTVPVELASEQPGASIELYVPSDRIGEDPPLVVCDQPCVAHVAPGRYKVYITETDETLGGSRIINLGYPSRLVIDPDTHEHRSVGLGLGIAGPILVVVGIAAIFSTYDCYDCPDRGRDSGEDTTIALGLLSMLGGFAATPIGWVMFGTSFKPEYEHDPLYARPRAAKPSWSVGVQPIAHGLSFGGQVRF